jgi:hypothetical protein
MNHPRNTRRAVLTALLSSVGLHPKRYLFRNPQPQLLAQFVEHIVTGWLEKWSENYGRPTYLQRLAAFQFGNELCIAIALGLEHHGQNSLLPYYNRFRDSWFPAEPETLVNLHTDLVHRLVRKHAHGATEVMQGVAAQVLASARGQGEPLQVVLESLTDLFDAHIEAATAIFLKIGMIDHNVAVSSSR